MIGHSTIMRYQAVAACGEERSRRVALQFSIMRSRTTTAPYIRPLKAAAARSEPHSGSRPRSGQLAYPYTSST